jgi:hypothetical protein
LNIKVDKMKRLKIGSPTSMTVLLLGLLGSSVLATRFHMLDTTLQEVAVHAGENTFNNGTSCIQVPAESAPAQCHGRWIYIPANSRHLVSAALAAKSGERQVRLYVDTEAPEGHCPGHAFTRCQVASIGVR